MTKTTVFFKSKSCHNCEHVEPIYNDLSEKYKTEIGFSTCDITQNISLAIDNAVLSVPTIIFFRDNTEYKRLTGLVNKDTIENVLKEL